MPDFLATMAAASRQRAAEARALVSDAEVREAASAMKPARPLQLHPGGFDVIAEVKREAPSAGQLSKDPGDAAYAARRAEAYARGGAAAVSVLTEPKRFRGSLDDLRHAARAVPAPAMRKDFLVDPYQVFEARAAGASGVLVIVRMLGDAEVPSMLEAAAACGLFVLLEAFDEHDLERAAGSAAEHPSLQTLLGVNTRDLATLEVDATRLERLAPHLPPGAVCVAESGIRTADDVRHVVGLGYRMALVGSALMTHEHPAALVTSMIEAGRREAMRECESG